MSSLLLCYTRKPEETLLYDAKLAYSMHLAIGEEEAGFCPLNHNSGVLFAKATENPDGSLNAMSLKSPYIFLRKDGSFGVMAVRTEGEGNKDASSTGSVLVWRTNDFVSYVEMGLLSLSRAAIEEIRCTYMKEANQYILQWKNEAGVWFETVCEEIDDLKADGAVKQIENQEYNQSIVWQKVEPGISDAVPGNVIEISEETAMRLCSKLLTPVNQGVYFPQKVTAGSMEELNEFKAIASYSNGTQQLKRIVWENIDFTKKGEQKIHGQIKQQHYPFPIALNRADPCIARWEGFYYFIATNDADANHSISIRKSASIQGLLDAPEQVILDSDTYEDIGNLLWAPEFHEIEGRLYIFHAATKQEFFCEESHVMELREGGDPTCRTDWSRPRRIVKADGSELCEAGKTISLDMTCFLWQKEYYVIWSQRTFLPKDLGAWLYIAKLNPSEPWKLLTEPVVLSKPEYGWANNHTFVDEGPFALYNKDKLFVTFSSAATDTSYVVGYLETEKGRDLTDPKSWRKCNYPILSSRSVPGEYGPGHNSYVIDEDGAVWNVYHARVGKDGPRSSGIRQVHFDLDGCPVLDVTEDQEILEKYRTIETILTVR